MLPGIDGISVCQQLRACGKDTPIIMLTARDTNQDIKLGLNIGADDYLIKPFDIEVLEARINSLVRRSAGSGFKKSISYGALSLDLKTNQVWRHKTEIILNPSCFKILKLMIEKSPAIASREDIEYILWADGTPDQDILRKHIYQLRSKVDKPFTQELIKTVPKLGYRITEEL